MALLLLDNPDKMEEYASTEVYIGTWQWSAEIEVIDLARIYMTAEEK